MTRPKSFLTYFAFLAIPLALIAGLNYGHGIRTVNSTLSTIVQDDLNSFNVAVDDVLRQRESEMLQLTLHPTVRNIINKTGGDTGFLHPLVGGYGPFSRLTVFDGNLRAVWDRKQNENDSGSPRPDELVWSLQGNALLDRPGNNQTVE